MNFNFFYSFLNNNRGQGMSIEHIVKLLIILIVVLIILMIFSGLSSIIFDSVGFKYASTEKRAIKDVNLNIEGGSMTAFVGHSGAGKSTIISLIPRFYDPQQGSIKIDNQDIRKVSLSSLRKNISLVSQDVILYI